MHVDTSLREDPWMPSRCCIRTFHISTRYSLFFNSETLFEELREVESGKGLFSFSDSDSVSWVALVRELE